MRLIFALLLAVAFCNAFCQGNVRNLENLRLLIKDSTTYSNLVSGVYEHPALEIGARKVYSEIAQRNYPIRIAIDPGHIASNRKEALIEDRYVNSKYGFFYESELNMATAILLKSLLESRGFEVMLSRNPKETAVGPTYSKWYKKYFKAELAKDLQAGNISQERYDKLIGASQQEVFQKYFRDKDFVARGEKINAFAPDITLIIHYNSSEFVNSPQSFSPEVDHNYSVCFIPGAFTNSELKQEAHLEDFIRLASTDIIQKSKILSTFIVNEFQSKLGAPSLKPEDDPELWYLKKYSVYTEVPGVYSRNLYLTRAINSPVCYGECLLQNNIHEVKALSRRELKVGPYKVSKRVEDVTNCYYAGTIKYFQYLGWIK